MAAIPVPTTPYNYYGTVRESYVDILTELVKEESPTLYVEDFLYYFNKAINEYLKIRYELFEITQQLTDDLRFWKKEHNTVDISIPTDVFNPAYRHLLACIVSVTAIRPDSSCGLLPNVAKRFKATRYTSEVKASILNNAYLEPAPYRPYFDMMSDTIRIDLGEFDVSTIKSSNILIEYLKQPEHVVLTPVQIEATTDSSQRLEFTRDIGDEINKIAIKLILERSSDQRLQTNVAVNQTINDPTIRGGQ